MFWGISSGSVFVRWAGLH